MRFLQRIRIRLFKTVSADPDPDSVKMRSYPQHCIPQDLIFRFRENGIIASYSADINKRRTDEAEIKGEGGKNEYKMGYRSNAYVYTNVCAYKVHRMRTYVILCALQDVYVCIILNIYAFNSTSNPLE